MRTRGEVQSLGVTRSSKAFSLSQIGDAESNEESLVVDKVMILRFPILCYRLRRSRS